MASCHSTTARCVTAATYIRASTSDQTESPDSQRALLNRIAPDHGLQLEFEYLDFAVSGGRTKTRDGLQRLLADARRGLFQALLVRDLSRLSRTNSLRAAANVIGPLLDCGVVIYTCTHGDLKLDSVTGRIMLAVMLEFDGEENQKRAYNIVNGQMAAVAKGSWIGAAPFGYRVEGGRHEKRLVLDDEQKAETVRRIFSQFASGDSSQAIADALNADGIASPSGRQWTRDSISKMLKRPAYVGDHRFNYESRGRYYQLVDGKPVMRCEHLRDGERPVTARNDESDWIVIPNHWPAIIDRKIWNRVQRRIARNASRKAQPTAHTWLLSGLLWCECGASQPMYGKFRCGKKRYHCEQCGAWVVECEVTQRLAGCIRSALSPGNVEAMRAEVERLVSQPDVRSESIRQLEGKLAEYERRLAEVSLDMVPRVENQIRTLERRIVKVRQQRQAAQNRPAQNVDQVMAGLFRLAEVLTTADAKTLKADLPEFFSEVRVKCLAVGRGGARRWRLSSGNATCRRDDELEPSSPACHAGVVAVGPRDRGSC